MRDESNGLEIEITIEFEHGATPFEATYMKDRCLKGHRVKTTSAGRVRDCSSPKLRCHCFARCSPSKLASVSWSKKFV